MLIVILKTIFLFPYLIFKNAKDKLKRGTHLFGIYGFYANRLREAPFYGLVQGREIIKMVCRCAFNDSALTDNESIVIMETCLDPELDNILLEVNYNETWKN